MAQERPDVRQERGTPIICSGRQRIWGHIFNPIGLRTPEVACLGHKVGRKLRRKPVCLWLPFLYKPMCSLSPPPLAKFALHFHLFNEILQWGIFYAS